MKAVPAKAYRLWRVDHDSLVPSHQVFDTSGFLLPESGDWIVEAWSDTVALGNTSDLHPQRQVKASCPQDVGRSVSGGNGIGVIECKGLLDSSSQKHLLSLVRQGMPRPLAMGAFRVSDTFHRFMRVPDTVAAYQFLIWKVRWDSIKGPDRTLLTHEKDSVMLELSGFQVSPQRGIVDVTLPSGDWLLEGWNYSINTAQLQDWLSKPHVKFADTIALAACRDRVIIDCGRPSQSPYANGVNAPDKIFYYHSP